MKILFVIDGLGTGGAERSLAELLPGLHEKGIRTIVACLRERSEGVRSNVEETGTDVHFLAGGSLSQIRALRRLLRREAPDLVHTTIFAASIAGRLAAIGSRAQVLTSLVNTPYAPVRLDDPEVHRLSLAGVRAIDGFTARRLTDHFHAISHAVAEWAIRDMKLDPARITVIERGRDPVRLGQPAPERRADVRRRIGLREDDEVVIAVGRQEYQKGQRFLLEAVGSLRRRHPRLVVLIAGRKGSSTTDLERLMASPEVGDAVRFLGHREDLPDLLAASDVFAFPSLYEGLGGSVLEAMALGLPVVASDIPVMREVVEDGGSGILVTPGSSAAIIDALDGLLRDEGRRRALGDRGRAIFADRFTVEQSTARMIALYERLVGGGASRAPVGSPSGVTDR